MMTMRRKLESLHAAAGGDCRGVGREKLLAAVQAAWGAASDLGTYRDFCVRWKALEVKGRWLAEWLVSYGSFPWTLTPDELEALDITMNFARALRMRHEVEVQSVASGGVGSLHYYSAYTGGDMKEAARLRNEAVARRALR